MVLAAAYALATHTTGDAVFSFIGAILLFLSLVPDEATSIPKRIAGVVIGTSLLDAYYSTVCATRGLFQKGDGFVRGVIMFLAVGGMAFVCKYGIQNFNMLPELLDVALKRMGPAIAIASVVVYPASLISKRIFALSMHTRDPIIRKYEFRFYVAVILFSVTILALGAGLPIEGKLPLRLGQTLIELPHWSEGNAWLLLYVAGIWLIWTIGTGACILSRFCEWNWRDRINSYLGAPAP
ncbi:hypothetical protein I6F34_11425 [Bradyrhizobium sp. BRP05]|nr:hypothetical protein [Bradyrhizobium sp. BRP05]